MSINMEFKYLLLIILYIKYSHENVINEMETENTCVVLSIPENELILVREISERLKIFLDRNLDQGLQRLKKVLNSSVNETETKELDLRNDEPLESYLMQHQILMHNDIKELLTDKREKARKRPTDCSDLRISGIKESGVYPIFPFTCSCSNPVEVFCDMETDGGGWTVFVARMKTSKQLNFTRNWQDYKTGFGSADKEYWLGNENLHKLTSNRNYVVRMDANDDDGKRTWGEWETFKVDSEENKYKLTIVNYNPKGVAQKKGTFSVHNGQKFTTYDQDNDSGEKSNCAVTYKGGWWYDSCHNMNPTGIYGEKKGYGIKIHHWDKYNATELFPVWLQLKIRPKHYNLPITAANSNSENCNK